MEGDVQSISDTELEELLDDDIMCGGNDFPHERPCPHGRKAVMMRLCLCGCAEKTRAQSFKCVDCYTEWLSGRIAKFGAKLIKCPKCGKVFRAPLGRTRYVPL